VATLKNVVDGNSRSSRSRSSRSRTRRIDATIHIRSRISRSRCCAPTAAFKEIWEVLLDERELLLLLLVLAVAVAAPALFLCSFGVKGPDQRQADGVVQHRPEVANVRAEPMGAVRPFANRLAQGWTAALIPIRSRGHYRGQTMKWFYDGAMIWIFDDVLIRHSYLHQFV
jgi:hypothetical protein